MQRSMLSLLFLALAVASCGAPSPTTTAGITQAPSRPTLSPTANPRAVLGQAAALYAGPGSANYENLASLPAGTTVTPSGLYGDFVQVTVVDAGKNLTGFIWKDALEDLPAGLPVLDRLQVPWEPFFLPTCSPGTYDTATDTVTFASLTTDEGYYTHSAAWTVSAPIRIQIKALKAQGNTWGSKPSNTEWSDVKVYGSTDLTIRSRAEDGKYEIDVHTPGGDLAKAIVLPQSSSRPIQILFDQPADAKPIGTSFSVLNETGQVLTTVDLTALPDLNLPDGLFPDGKLFFGTDTMANSSLLVTGLTIGSQPAGQWVEQASINADLSSPGLAKLAQGTGITIGSEFTPEYAIDRRYCQAMLHDFNLADLSESTFKWFWPGRGEYAWGVMDREVDFALQHGLRVRAYLGWGAPEAIPDWLLNSNYTRDEYITILEDYMRSVMAHFKGRIQEWVIANEADERILCNDEGYYDFWYRKIGPDFIKLEFQTAREADPGAILILNDEYDFSSHFPPPYDCRNRTIQKMQATVSALNAGDPKLVDGIGMEMHLLGAWLTVPPKKEDMLKIMQSFSRLGVKIAITEMDVNLAFIQDKYSTRDARWTYQAGIYTDMLEACLESGACDSFTTMGISDSMSWIVNSCQGCWDKPQPNGDPLMFDNNFLPKPAYFTVRDALASANASATSKP